MMNSFNNLKKHFKGEFMISADVLKLIADKNRDEKKIKEKKKNDINNKIKIKKRKKNKLIKKQKQKLRRR